MPPRNATQVDKKQKKDDNNDDSKKDGEDKDKERDKEDRKDMNNLINQLKAAKKRIEQGKPNPGDEQKVEAMGFWNSLERIDQKKHEILNKWRQDKSFNWWQTYQKTQSVENIKEKEKMEGYGTRPFLTVEKTTTNKSNNNKR